jgi:hypothetical protein
MLHPMVFAWFVLAEIDLRHSRNGYSIVHYSHIPGGPVYK